MWNWLKAIFGGQKVTPPIKENKFDFVAVDFETANHQKSSICSCGLVAVKNNDIVEQQHFLICPKELKFHYMNTKVHGLGIQDVQDKPQFNIIWPALKPYLDNGLIVAHNASFDIFALKDVLHLYQIPTPQMDYLCTVKLAKKTLPQVKNHKLDTLAQHFAISLNHHDALSDAVACAKVVIEICKLHEVASLHDLINKLDISKYVKHWG